MGSPAYRIDPSSGMMVPASAPTPVGPGQNPLTQPITQLYPGPNPGTGPGSNSSGNGPVDNNGIPLDPLARAVYLAQHPNLIQAAGGVYTGTTGNAPVTGPWGAGGSNGPGGGIGTINNGPASNLPPALAALNLPTMRQLANGQWTDSNTGIIYDPSTGRQLYNPGGSGASGPGTYYDPTTGAPSTSEPGGYRGASGFGGPQGGFNFPVNNPQHPNSNQGLDLMQILQQILQGNNPSGGFPGQGGGNSFFPRPGGGAGFPGQPSSPNPYGWLQNMLAGRANGMGTFGSGYPYNQANPYSGLGIGAARNWMNRQFPGYYGRPSQGPPITGNPQGIPGSPGYSVPPDYTTPTQPRRLLA